MSVKRWNGTSWVTQAGNATAAKYQATAPANPVAGDIWIKSDVDTPTVATSVFYRWRKTASGGETSLSGFDDVGLSLSYTPNYEQLFINGVLQVRNVDYTPTSSTSVTGLVALTASDVVEIMSPNVYSVNNVYTQATSDAKYSTLARTGQFLVVPTSVSVGSGSFALSSNGQVTFTGASSVAVDGCFTSAYQNYVLFFNSLHSTTLGAYSFRYRAAGVDFSTANYFQGGTLVYYNNATVNSYRSNAGTSLDFGGGSPTYDDSQMRMEIISPMLAQRTRHNMQGIIVDATSIGAITASGTINSLAAYDGFKVTSSAGTMSGTIRVYGYNNGA